MFTFTDHRVQSVRILIFPPHPVLLVDVGSESRLWEVAKSSIGEVLE